jgi:steroid 5-alpha reductase family enzyme
MDQLISVLSSNLTAALGLMFAVWTISLIEKNASIVDIVWGLGFVLIAWLTFFQAEGNLERQVLLTGLTTIWGLRLSFHIFKRNWGQGKDRRYQAWREKRGKSFWWVSLFLIFWPQAVLMWIISLSVQVGQLSPGPPGLVGLDVLGTLVWTVGFAFEAVADRQLARFQADPENQGKVMNQGLWAYSRHPNYFGETLIWWGLWLIACATPGGVWTIASPLTITYLLLQVSGVTLLEKDIADRRPEYREYQESVSAFIPWFPKRKTSE